MSKQVTDRFERLQRIVHACGSVCIGYSGGVDSVLLAVVAVDVLGADNVLAVTGLSPSYPAVQRAVAQECAARFGIPHREIVTYELEDDNYAQNPANRCYYCKAELWPRLLDVARTHGCAAVLDGSNADDASDYRPGYAAAVENGVRSPLREAGLTKADVRELSRRRGLPTWDQPSAPCLASRLPYGIAVTPERLRQVEAAETALRALGHREFRVRHHDDCARVELAPEELGRAEMHPGALFDALRHAGFGRVLLDVEGYRSGALNETLIRLAPRAGAAAALPAHSVAGHHRDIAVVDTPSLADARATVPALRRAGFRYVAVDLAPTPARFAGPADRD